MKEDLFDPIAEKSKPYQRPRKYISYTEKQVGILEMICLNEIDVYLFVAETLRRRTDPKMESAMKLKEKRIEANE